MKTKRELIAAYKNTLLSVNRVEGLRLLKEIYDIKNNFVEVSEVIRIVLDEIGKEWEEGSVSLSQVYMSGILCEEFINILLPDQEIIKKNKPRIGIGVLLDNHGLGKKIVSSLVKLNGYEVIDLGNGLSVNEMATIAIAKDINVLLISTLMISSALKVKEVIKLLHTKNKDIKVIAGGAPFRLDNNLWKEVGTDANVSNVADIAKVIEEVVRL